VLLKASVKRIVAEICAEGGCVENIRRENIEELACKI
jgi:hypothetical protein